MISREDAIAIALKLAADEQPESPIERVGDVFTMDGGRTWTVHLCPQQPTIDGRWIAVDTPGVWAVVVNGQTGIAKWVEML
jgi:hypothetical protein